MSQIEDHLRDALSDVADEIPANGVPPLNLPADPDNVVRLADRWDAGRRRRWLAPAAAAAAVLAIAAAAAITGSGPHPPAGSSVQQVPPYYLALRTVSQDVQSAAIYATTTGKLITVPRYRGAQLENGYLAGSADGTTFVSTGPGSSITQRIYLIKFNPATRKARVRPLAAPVIPSPDALAGLALSPDGTRLAVAYQPTASPTSGRYDLTVIDLATGRARTWTSSAGAFSPGPTYYWSVSWAADDQTVAFNWFAGWQKSALKPLLRGSGVRLLDTALPGGDLVTSSNLALPFSAQGDSDRAVVSAGVVNPAWLTPDGKTIVLPVADSGSHRYGLAAYSAQTGDLKRTFDDGEYDLHRPVNAENVLWVSRDGRTLIVVGTPGHPNEIGIVRGNDFTLLPRPPSLANVYSAW